MENNPNDGGEFLLLLLVMLFVLAYFGMLFYIKNSI